MGLLTSMWEKTGLHTASQLKEGPNWEKVADSFRHQLLAVAERYQAFRWPPLPATLYMDFARTGQRAAFEAAYFQRQAKGGIWMRSSTGFGVSVKNPVGCCRPIIINFTKMAATTGYPGFRNQSLTCLRPKQVPYWPGHGTCSGCLWRQSRRKEPNASYASSRSGSSHPIWNGMISGGWVFGVIQAGGAERVTEFRSLSSAVFAGWRL